MGVRRVVPEDSFQLFQTGKKNLLVCIVINTPPSVCMCLKIYIYQLKTINLLRYERVKIAKYLITDFIITNECLTSCTRRF